MKRCTLLLGVLLLCNTFLAAQKKVPARFQDLPKVAEKVLADWNAPGCAIAIVEKDQVVFSGGFGYRDYENRLPVTENTIFQIGSSTKAFTGALIGALQKDGLLDYDDPFIQYMPELVLENEYLTSHLTIRDALCHRSGLPRHDLSWYFNPTTRDSLVWRMRYFEASAPLREKWQYNNFGYLLLGVLAEKLSSDSWEGNIQKRFFEPLQMPNAGFRIWDLPANADVARGYADKNGLVKPLEYYRIEGMGPAGSICASAREMGNWMIPWLNKGVFQGKEVLPPAYVETAMSSQMVVAPGFPSAEQPELYFVNYGFGWFLSSYRGHYRVEHGGNINGFTASVCLFPTEQIGIVVLTNQDGSAVNAILRNTIADKMLGLSDYDWNADLKEGAAKRKAAMNTELAADSSGQKKGTRPSHVLAEYAGAYEHPGYGTIRVELHGDSLIGVTQAMRFYLKHYHYDIFKAVSLESDIDLESDGNNFLFQFNTDLRGDIAEMQTNGLELSVKPLVFKRKAVSVSVSRAELERYVGRYVISGMETKVYLRESDNTLMVVVPGQPEYATRPVGTHEFKLADLEGYSVRFEMDAAGNAVAMYFIQPNGTFKAMRK